MQRPNSFSFIRLTALTFLVTCFSMSFAQGSSRCEEVFRPSFTRWFPAKATVEPTPVVDLKANTGDVLAKTAKALNGELLTKADITARTIVVVKAALMTEKITLEAGKVLNLGYDFAKTDIEIATGFERSAFFVSAEPMSMQHLTNKIIRNAKVLNTQSATESLEAHIEVAAALVGSPSERIIVQSSASGSGIEFTSVAIFNSQTGAVLRFNFFDMPKRSGSGKIGPRS